MLVGLQDAAGALAGLRARCADVVEQLVGPRVAFDGQVLGFAEPSA